MNLALALGIAETTARLVVTLGGLLVIAAAFVVYRDARRRGSPFGETPREEPPP